MKAYVVRQGEYLSKLAFRFGFDANDVWQHEKNKELREQRSNPEVLCPGDLLWIPKRSTQPALTLTRGTTNRYTARVPLVPVHLVLKDDKKEPIANESYRVEAAGLAPIEGTTGGDGAVDFEVPVHIHSVRLTIESRRLRMNIAVGSLDPVTELTGVQQRLKQLGLFRGNPDGNEHSGNGRAIRAFQRSAGLEVTGVMNDETRNALLERCGS